MLCSTIIDHVQTLSNSLPDAGYAYYYFTFTDERKQTAESFLRSVISQLCSQMSTLPDEVLALYQQGGKQQQQPEIGTLIKTFLSVTKHFQHVYLLIDALDESTELEATINLIYQIVAPDETPGKSSLLITSRREPDIIAGLTGIVTSEVCIRDGQIKEDIKLHIQSRLQSDSKLKGQSDSMKREIENALVNGANGM